MTRSGYFGALATKLRRPLPPPAAGVETEAPSEYNFRTTYVLSDFVTEVGARIAPVIVDLGPAIGANVAFLGQETACKLFIEDLLARRSNRSSGTGNGQLLRLRQPDASVDGVLCWDVLDHFRPAARAVLRPNWFACCGRAACCWWYHRVEVEPHPDRVVYEIVGPRRLCLRGDGDTAARPERPLQHRELELMFGELTATKTVLLKNRMREVLFRKSAWRLLSNDGNGSGRRPQGG